MNTETLIVGAGPAGLSIAACLKRRELPFILLEKSDKIGASWHKHYDRLHLHTDKKNSELPFFSYPKSYPTFPSRLQFIDYLEQYARHFDLKPRFNQAVTSIRYNEDHWITRTPDQTYRSENLVLATGYNRKPIIPTWPGKETFSGEIIHSVEYSNGKFFRGKEVLVVGFGNSGGEIAMDLHEHEATSVSMVVRGPVNIIPRDLFGIPVLDIAITMAKVPPKLADLFTAPLVRLVIGDFSRLGLQKKKEGPITQINKYERIPLIDVGTVRYIREGHIKIYPGIQKFEADTIHFTDGRSRAFDAVILATGFRPDLEYLLDEQYLEDKQLAMDHNLYFCGFHVTPFGMLRELAMEAKEIAKNICPEL